MTDTRVLLKRLLSAFPAAEIREPTLLLMAEKFADVPGVDLETAIENHIETGKFFPTIGELRARIEAQKPRMHDQSWDAHLALPAWEKTSDYTRASIAELNRHGILGPNGRTRCFPNAKYYEGMQDARDRMDRILERNAELRTRGRQGVDAGKETSP